MVCRGGVKKDSFSIRGGQNVRSGLQKGGGAGVKQVVTTEEEKNQCIYNAFYSIHSKCNFQRFQKCYDSNSIMGPGRGGELQGFARKKDSN